MKRALIPALLLAACSKDPAQDPAIEPPPPPIPTASAAQAPRAATPKIVRPREVELSKVLDEYRSNELRADGQFKGRFVQTFGVVGAVSKDLDGNAYVTIGRGADLEIPVLQCFLAKGQEAAAAELSAGKPATLRGVIEGLMVNVIAKDCVVNPMMQVCNAAKAKLGVKRCQISAKSGDVAGWVFEEDASGKNSLSAYVSCETDREDVELAEAHNFRLTKNIEAEAKDGSMASVIGSSTYCMAILSSKVDGKPAAIHADIQTRVRDFLDAL